MSLEFGAGMLGASYAAAALNFDVDRKTGAFLKDTGERDEHGMQPLDAIFSSPGGAGTNQDGSGSEDMEISLSELYRASLHCAADLLLLGFSGWLTTSLYEP